MLKRGGSLPIQALFLASYTGASVVLRSGPPSPWCARESFSNPRWEVQDFSYIPPEQAQNDTTAFLSFGLVNEAHGSWTSCDYTRQNIAYAAENKMQSWICHMPMTFFRFDGDTGSLSIEQTWGCSDLVPRDRQSWVGNGTVIMPAYTKPSAENPYTATNVTIKASLLEPVQISPIQPIPPKPPLSVGSSDCSAASTWPSWAISDFVFDRNYHAVWVDFANHYNDLSLTVTNTATGAKTACSASVRDLAGISSTTIDWYFCGRLSVAFLPEYQWLGIKDSWSCNDTDSNITSFSAVGYKQLDLNCTTHGPVSTTDIPLTINTTRYTCTVPDNQTVQVAGYLEPAPDFPHSNYNDSCTVSSFNLTALSLTAFTHQSLWELEQLNSPEVLVHDVLIDLYNPATRDQYRIQGSWWEEQGSNEASDTWRPCQDPADGKLLGCEYMYNNVTNDVGVRITWFCDDRDPEHAITFTAQANATMPQLECVPRPEPGTEVGQPGRVRDGDIKCSLPDSNSEVQLGIKSFQWNSTLERIDIGPVFPWYN